MGLAGLRIEIDQSQLCQEYGITIKNELQPEFRAIRIEFPEKIFHALEALKMRYFGEKQTFKYFSKLDPEDVANLKDVGITSDKIKQIACLAVYYAEKHYLNAQDSTKEAELKKLADQGIQFKVFKKPNRSKDLVFKHAWLRI